MTKLRQWTTFALAPLWRWKWLFLLCLAATLSYNLFAISDETSYNPDQVANLSRLQPCPVARYASYGWPLHFERRMYSNVFSTSRRAIWTDVIWFSTWRGCVNVAVAIAISLLVTSIVAYRFASWRRWQFGIRDLGVLTIAIALLFAIGRHWESAYQVDRRYLESLQPHGIQVGRDYTESFWFRRPWRDAGLISSDAASPATLYFQLPSKHRPGSVDPDMNQLLLDAAAQRRQIRHPIRWMSFQDVPLNDAGLAALGQIAPSSDRLHLTPSDDLTDQATATIVRAWPTLIDLKFGSPALTRQTLDTLQELPQLELLAIADCSGDVTPEDLQLLEELPHLRRLGLSESLLERMSPAQLRRWSDRGVELYRAWYFHSYWYDIAYP
ncbi:hypothetical protein LOC68_12910 [Blastopirellula sp. JC732]|uniref:Uncharacterized protein n=1 Tax=Blastopirellula sediminis TaxID=2894196 RepID=A0A9X1MN20_9BACT|nr:hypothetical protein [Blastopirellula sediminis]MCC9607410.1 hypothetical protein [Blastopirellula sediminis]MCC9629297.1 hypothetical protein [Blastopirellula sediminis]